MIDDTLEPRSVRTRIETSDRESLPAGVPIATFEHDRMMIVPNPVEIVVWLDEATARSESMEETLDLVVDAWIERYCTQLSGGFDTDPAEQLYHSVVGTPYLERAFRAVAIKHIGSATVDVAEAFAPTADAFLAYVSDQVGDISLDGSTVTAVRASLDNTALAAAERSPSDDDDD